MYWNYVVWCCFHWEKCKRPKTQHRGKSLMSDLHNGSTLEHNSNWFRKLQWRATTFVFSIFRNWSCDQQPNNPLHRPWYTESSWCCFSWLFGHTLLSDFLVTMCELPSSEICTDHVDTSSLFYHVYSCFSSFSGYICISYHIGKCAQTM